jgi:hypothetical protein
MKHHIYHIVKLYMKHHYATRSCYYWNIHCFRETLLCNKRDVWNIECIDATKLDVYAWWCSWPSFSCFLTSGVLHNGILFVHMISNSRLNIKLITLWLQSEYRWFFSLCAKFTFSPSSWAVNASSLTFSCLPQILPCRINTVVFFLDKLTKLWFDLLH